MAGSRKVSHIDLNIEVPIRCVVGGLVFLLLLLWLLPIISVGIVGGILASR